LVAELDAGTHGVYLSKEIGAVGKDVKLFEEGGQVFCIGSSSLGAYAEYVCRPEDRALVI
jgi:NADPH:quinone reductase-like Zn-dependent oxidoreductase